MEVDFERFEETAAILEFDEGMARFDAETEAARRQGVQRWEAMKCEQRVKYFSGRESLSANKPEHSAPLARSAARTEKRNATPAYPSRSSPMVSSGTAGIATL